MNIKYIVLNNILMLSNLPKNLLPKFHQYSRITPEVKKIMNDIIINPKFINTNIVEQYDYEYEKQYSSYNNNIIISKYYHNNFRDLSLRLDNIDKVKEEFSMIPFEKKKEMFLKVADLLETKYYNHMLAYTILSQNKTIYEAEIDAICELVDFIRFNVRYAEIIKSKQPISINEIKNVSEYNSLDGFVASITPFNFTAIGGNLASAPLLFDNIVFWKPSKSSILSNHLFYEIMLEAGFSPNIINFILMDGNDFGNTIINRKELSSILFTGSSKVFEDIIVKTSTNISKYNTYPRLIGETGGKNFHFIAPDFEDINFTVKNTIESAFGYSGQKCSACSVVYVPKSKLDDFCDIIKIETNNYIKNIENYGVIDEIAFYKLSNIIKILKEDSDVSTILKSTIDSTSSWYIGPHIFKCNNLSNNIFKEEYFGPIIAIYPYDDNMMKETVEYIKYKSNKYALTGSIFSNDDKNLKYLSNMFKHKAGNFYINDKSTGSIVGQQPFGGSGKSGTNDKAGDINLLFRLFNQRNIKINLNKL